MRSSISSAPKRALLGSLLLVAATGLVACSSPSTTSSTGGGAQEQFNALAAPQEVPALLRDELGESVTVRRVTLSENGFSAEVRDSEKPQNLDRFSYYSGQWDTDPISVNMSDIENLDKTTFGLGAVDWRVITELQQKALDGLDLEDEEVTSVSVDRIAGQPPRIYVNVNGSRGSGGLTANARGGDVEIRRY